jgi:hypothetical protein
MAALNWIAEELKLSPAALTVLAQAVPPNDTGLLSWPLFFPKQPVDSVDLQDVTTLDYRPAADRREWNARGRLIPMPTPATRKVQIVPIEARDALREQELQKITERAMGNQQLYRDIIGLTIPQRVVRLAESCYRRLEIDAISAWTAGTITQRNPEDASKTYTASFGFASSHYTTAGTAWNDVTVNAYDLFQAWIVAAEDLIGPIRGAVMRLATYNAILDDAPNLPENVTMTRSGLEQRISQDRGREFRVVVNEQSVDVFDDGGTAYTRTKLWPAQKIAAIPDGDTIGRTCFAPVRRAMDIQQSIPEAGVDVRGVTVYYDQNNLGKGMEVECQLNALPLPSESRLYVTNVGV